jgi:predicted DNA-binding protein
MEPIYTRSDSALSVKATQTRAFATRLPAPEAERLEAVVEETNQTKSAVVRRAIRYYLEQNPDRARVLFPEDSLDRLMTEMLE